MKLKNIPLDQYDFNKYELEIKDFWLQNKFYKPEYNPVSKSIVSTEDMKIDDRKPFCIICPPPNAYGRPHIGNLSGYAYEDAMGRFSRMNGKKVLLLPGKDHAGLEGEGVFVREVLEKKEINKFSLSREEFYKMIYEFNMVNKDKALQDEKTIGLMADFDRDLFTLDERVVETVLSTFINLYNDNMIYKGVRIGNWDPKARSVIADNQCIRQERDGFLYTIKYPIVRGNVWILNYNNEQAYERIKSGIQTIDIRALNPQESDRYFGDIHVGDLIVCRDITKLQNPSVYKKVSSVKLFQNFDDLYQSVDWKNFLGKSPQDILEVDEYFSGLQIDYSNKIRHNGSIVFSFEDLDEEDFIKIATTRPETLFGDTAVAVNPTDSKYAELLNYKIIVPLVDRIIPLITDPKVEKEFGTGALKITPAHAQDDYQIMLNWNQLVDKELHDNESVLESYSVKKKIGYVNVIDRDLKMCGPVGLKYFGLKYNAVKPIVIEDLKIAGLFVGEVPIKQNVLIAERTKALVEPIMISQWFMDVDKIRQPVVDMVRSGQIKIHPKYMEKKFYNWMENLRDWSISRSLWWGYRLPVWYRGEITEKINSDGIVTLFIVIDGQNVELNPSDLNHMRVQLEKPQGDSWIQDPDVLDTWFSSGQWPYATLTTYNLMDTFYPTNVMETAYDILENWVSRMMMFSYYRLKKIPFENIYLHGIVKGTDGQKMSKSRKNLIEVDDIQKSYGIDSLRMSFFYQNKAGKAYSITFDKLKNFRNFNNKLWNAAKYVLRTIDSCEINNFQEFDQNVLHKIKYVSEDNKNIAFIIKDRFEKTGSHFEKYKFGFATEKIYDSFWHDFCDSYIEKTKEILKTDNYELITETTSLLLVGFIVYLKMLHPFIPFVTEKIYQLLRENDLVFEEVESIMYSKWKI